MLQVYVNMCILLVKPCQTRVASVHLFHSVQTYCRSPRCALTGAIIAVFALCTRCVRAERSHRTLCGGDNIEYAQRQRRGRAFALRAG